MYFEALHGEFYVLISNFVEHHVNFEYTMLILNNTYHATIDMRRV